MWVVKTSAKMVDSWSLSLSHSFSLTHKINVHIVFRLINFFKSWHYWLKINAFLFTSYAVGNCYSDVATIICLNGISLHDSRSWWKKCIELNEQNSILFNIWFRQIQLYYRARTLFNCVMNSDICWKTEEHLWMCVLWLMLCNLEINQFT